MPRYMVMRGDKRYITEWVSFADNGDVAVVDLATNTVTKRIPVRIPAIVCAAVFLTQVAQY
jgi:YVTN family beta-propeller protein